MRIIGGQARGIKLNAPEGYYVRPTNDLVKEAMFNILGNIADCVVLDLFSGSGALGLEALSRGANKVIFVEREKKGIQTIKENLLRVQKNLNEDCLASGRVSILQEDVEQAITKLEAFASKIDLIFADPPYQTDDKEFGSVKLLLDKRLQQQTKNTILVLEHADKTALPWSPHTNWKMIKQRKFGMRCLSFARNQDQEIKNDQ